MPAAGVPPETAERQARVANLDAEVAQLTHERTRLTEAPTQLRRHFVQRIKPPAARVWGLVWALIRICRQGREGLSGNCPPLAVPALPRLIACGHARGTAAAPGTCRSPAATGRPRKETIR